ncbi:hypothetical protein FGO68_gene16535 [Halteria grandinella]|uniref:Uncharacterized protein n=1 Tax=Halteria grandinella TaxID=5974 RepID=A0A8J8T706_HALGN|nr:hypothetical protein FGO68_gene16535 [Halteria grandinella]
MHQLDIFQVEYLEQLDKSQTSISHTQDSVPQKSMKAFEIEKALKLIDQSNLENNQSPIAHEGIKGIGLLQVSQQADSSRLITPLSQKARSKGQGNKGTKVNNNIVQRAEIDQGNRNPGKMICEIEFYQNSNNYKIITDNINSKGNQRKIGFESVEQQDYEAYLQIDNNHIKQSLKIVNGLAKIIDHNFL